VGSITAILSALIVYLPTPMVGSERVLAVIRTCAIGTVTLAAAIPLLLLTGALSRTELRAIRNVVPMPKRRAYASD